ncbi:MAG: O-antigen ligase family protein [Saprospiraceae bacterium]|nr:O-antigen ligase family protein [Saprospiraceae bacterium]
MIGTDAVLFSLGSGLEIRFSLILKVLFFFMNIMVFAKDGKIGKVFMPFIILSALILSSCISVLFQNKTYFLNSLSVSAHIILTLNIALFIYNFAKDEDDIRRLFNGIRLFGIINALLVILSYLKPDLSNFFEAGVVQGDTSRAFGIMGDEVSLIIVFFSLDAVVRKKLILFIIYFTALLCTGSIGATFSFVFIMVLYSLRNFKFNVAHLGYLFFGACIILGSFWSLKEQIEQIGVVKRINTTLRDPESENGNLRLASLLTASEMVIEKPFLGYGFGTYQYYVKERFEPVFRNLGLSWKFPSAMTILGSAFNPYIQIVCEAGLVGLTVFLIFIRGCFKNAREMYRKNKESDDEVKREISIIVYFWLITFFVTVISANWLLPASFLFILFVTSYGMISCLSRSQLSN